MISEASHRRVWPTLLTHKLREIHLYFSFFHPTILPHVPLNIPSTSIAFLLYILFKSQRVVKWITPCFVFRRSRLQISARKPAILTEVFRWFFSVSAGKYRESAFNWTTTDSFHTLREFFHLTLCSLSY
jgi:hypothetical protein